MSLLSQFSYADALRIFTLAENINFDLKQEVLKNQTKHKGTRLTLRSTANDKSKSLCVVIPLSFSFYICKHGAEFRCIHLQ